MNLIASFVHFFIAPDLAKRIKNVPNDLFVVNLKDLTNINPMKLLITLLWYKAGSYIKVINY